MAVQLLTDWEEATTDSVFLFEQPDQVVCSRYGIQLTQKDLLILDGTGWLNDKVGFTCTLKSTSQTVHDSKFPFSYVADYRVLLKLACRRKSKQCVVRQHFLHASLVVKRIWESQTMDEKGLVRQGFPTDPAARQWKSLGANCKSVYNSLIHFSQQKLSSILGRVSLPWML